MFAFIGKLWLSRIIEQEKASLQSKLTTLQANLNATTKKFEAELQRSVHIDKLQFDYEFKIYKEVWFALVELRIATMRLRPTFDQLDPLQSKENRIKERQDAFFKSLANYRDVVEKTNHSIRCKYITH